MLVGTVLCLIAGARLMSVLWRPVSVSGSGKGRAEALEALTQAQLDRQWRIRAGYWVLVLLPLVLLAIFGEPLLRVTGRSLSIIFW